MRILFVSAPMLGHVFPLVPLALELRKAGHSVVVATGGEAERVRESGLDVDTVLSSVHMGRLGLTTALFHPGAARAEMNGEGDLQFVSLLFAKIARKMTKQLDALVARWSPDLIIHEPLAAAAAVVAAKHRIPAVVHDVSLFDGMSLTSAVAARLGKEIPSPHAVLRTSPPSVADFGSGWPLRFVPYSGGGEVPDWLRRPASRPRILISRSTVAGPGGGKMMSAVIAAAPSVDAEFVVVRPESEEPLPPNVRAVDWVPLTAAVPRCTAVVHHGGAGTLLGALAAGVPQLIEPGVGDRTRHANLVAQRGAGLAVAAADLTPEVLTQLVTDTSLARAAKEVSAEIAAMPSPARVAARLTA
jgi:UDP:flavonoid glycosyltransferase YjiC (YdhE family)